MRNEIVKNIPNGQTVGEWIRSARRASDYPTQTAFAAKIGLSQAQLSKLERGEQRPSREVLNRIARLAQRAIGDHQTVLELDGLRLTAPALQAAGAVAGLVARVPGADAVLLRHVRAAFAEIAAALPPGASPPGLELEPDPVTGVYSLHPAELARSMAPGRLSDAIFREAFPTPGSAILDVGCGGGHNAAALQRLGYDVTAVDASPAMLQEAGRLFPELAGRLAEGRLPGLPRTREPGFDGVLCAGVLHELEPTRQEAAIRNLAGLLAPGGRLLCTVPTEPFDGDGPEWPPFHALPPEVLWHVGAQWMRLRPMFKRALEAAPGRPSVQLFEASA
jgi:SAM-dependent methyltransferase/transcriptional regulator with XRE-family HTH domain